jgi:hypothetical protein
MALLCGTFLEDNYLAETPVFVKPLLGSIELNELNKLIGLYGFAALPRQLIAHSS